MRHAAPVPRGRRGRLAGAAGLSLLSGALASAPAAAQAVPPAPAAPMVRTSDHPGYGRLEVALPPGAAPELSQEGTLLRLRLPGVGGLAGPSRVPRNIAAIAAGDGILTIGLMPGTSLRARRQGGWEVIDVLDPQHGDPRHGSAGAATAAPLALPPIRQDQIPPAAQTASPRPAAGLPAAAGLASGSIRPPAAAPLPAPGPVRAEASVPVRSVASGAAEPPGPTPSATPPALGPASPGPAPSVLPASPPALPAAAAVQPAGPFLFPVAATVGAAAFRRGDDALLVFDAPGAANPASLAAAGLRGATVRNLPGATMLRLPLSPAQALRLTRTAAGWSLAIRPQAEAGPVRPFNVEDAHGTLLLHSLDAARVVAVPDPMTGATLLVGTERMPAEGMETLRRAAEFTLLPTWLGAAAEPLSDRVALRAVTAGFALEGGGQGLALAAPADVAARAADAAGLSRSWTLPDLPADALMRRLRTQTLAAALAPPQARGAPRRAAAETMLALGLGPEAAAMLELASADDPPLAQDPATQALRAAALLLADQPQAAGALDNPALPVTDEVTLWRAVRDALTEARAPETAAALAREMSLLLAYPETMRARLAPLAAEAMLRGGRSGAAERLLAARSQDHRLDYARALLAEQQGRTDAALSGFDALANGRDRRDHARAAIRAVELRLQTGRITEAQAADALDRLIPAWRGGEREFRLRLRIAALRAHTGAWRQALAMLHETAEIWPDRRDLLRSRAGEVFQAMLRPENAAAVPPLDFVALTQESADLMPQGAEGRALAPLLAQKLAALDLPKQAGALLARLAADATGPARANYGARLAQLRLEAGDPAGAREALDRTKDDGAEAGAAPDPALSEHRLLLRARALAGLGQPQQAASLLAPQGSDAADDLRATILADAKDWPGAESALRALVERAVPADGALDAHQRGLLLRLAVAATEAGDRATLGTLRTRDSARMQGDGQAGLFRLLTAPPLTGVADLKRAGAELSLANALPAELKAIGAR